MIKEYFILNNYFYIEHLKIINNFIIIQIKSPINIPKNYYRYLLKYLYKIKLKSLTSKTYNKYYKIVILKYKLNKY